MLYFIASDINVELVRESLIDFLRIEYDRKSYQNIKTKRTLNNNLGWCTRIRTRIINARAVTFPTGYQMFAHIEYLGCLVTPPHYVCFWDDKFDLIYLCVIKSDHFSQNLYQ